MEWIKKVLHKLPIRCSFCAESDWLEESISTTRQAYTSHIEENINPINSYFNDKVYEYVEENNDRPDYSEMNEIIEQAIRKHLLSKE